LSIKNNAIIVTGVAGSGKTSVGSALAVRLGASFYDGDEFHPESNITKMSSGIPLSDEDRLPWLNTINQFVNQKLPSTSVVITCSALKEVYRKILAADIDPSLLTWVHLQGDFEVIHQRIRERAGHFMTANMLRSQVDTYEMPTYGIHVDINQDLNQIVRHIISEMKIAVSEVGLIGLGVMGTSLARNIAGKGFTISLFNRHVAGKEEGIAKKMTETYKELSQSMPFDELQKFVLSLRSPRKIILMVNAGQAVDDVVLKLLPLLDAGDVIVDGGNSHYKDTASRQKNLAEQKIHFVGAGVSGGEEGALLGPSIMPGGSRTGYDVVKDILLAIAARNEQDEVCCDYIGDSGAGHFVKMVHNGIEYAEMQLIAEFYDHLRHDQKKKPEEIATIFERWNQGTAHSYLLTITIDILRFKDSDGLPLLDKISDVAGNKGTGGWTAIAASELGVPVPAMAEALFSRYLSAFKSDRTRYAALYGKKDGAVFIDADNLLNTFMFCRLMNHDQGLKLIKEASENFNWKIDTSVLLKIWSGGCIIRSSLLAILRKGWKDIHSDVLQHPYSTGLIGDHLSAIKDTVSKLALSDRAYPVATSGLDYFKSLTSSRTNAYMIQAQRDYFGAHTYKRTDDASGNSHHTKWS
jgi:6-phosphogluconate dehydrogenase